MHRWAPPLTEARLRNYRTSLFIQTFTTNEPASLRVGVRPARTPTGRCRPLVGSDGRAGLSGGALMLQLTPQSRIFVATAPVAFRQGIDGLAAVCRRVRGDNSLADAVYIFRNRTGTVLQLLLYNGQSDWLCLKRVSQGCFTWWPQTADARVLLSARKLIILLWNGNPDRAQMAQDWWHLPSEGASGA